MSISFHATYRLAATFTPVPSMHHYVNSTPALLCKAISTSNIYTCCQHKLQVQPVGTIVLWHSKGFVVESLKMQITPNFSSSFDLKLHTDTDSSAYFGFGCVYSWVAGHHFRPSSASATVLLCDAPGCVTLCRSRYSKQVLHGFCFMFYQPPDIIARTSALSLSGH